MYRPPNIHLYLSLTSALLFMCSEAHAQNAPPAASAATPAAADVPDQSGPTPAAAPDRDYILGPEDVIEVGVVGRSDFNVRARISQAGSIQLPYLGTVTAANMTTQELSDKLGKALDAGGYYTKPVVSVDIVSFASRYVTILGEVGQPGLVPVDRPYHFSEILARVGGARSDAADYVVVRPEKGQQQKLSIRLLATGDPSQDPLVQPGDKIFVPKAEQFYISGQVKAPGAYVFENGMTLRMAISRAGGLTDLGTDHGVRVTSKDGRPLHLTLDQGIDGGEVIVIGERLF
jgi:polysaccharide biosynthesis/export protein